MSAQLSNIELYFSDHFSLKNETVFLTGDEFLHAKKVMRHKPGDEVFVTNGNGLIIKGKTKFVGKDNLSLAIKEKINLKNENSNIHFCIPKLKNPDRFKFAIEKCVELGITNFIVFESVRTVSKSANLKRWEKIALSAMKQSLRAFLPQIKIVNILSEIADFEGEKILFEQNSQEKFHFKNDKLKNYYFVFGPEGGFTDDEMKMFTGSKIYNLSGHRLRSETAIIKAASLI